MSNPFEKLHVKREESDDDDQGEFQKVKGKEKNVPIGLEHKKKKNRPVEKVQDDDNEGFEEVPNKMKKKRPVNDEEEEEAKGGEHKKRKGINYQTVEDKEYRTKDKPKRGRQFDRHSGTGRGKEIAKGGAGGKGTWGENPKNIARDFENNEEYDDYYFESALNPEKRKEKPPRKPKKDESKEDNKEGEEGGEEKNEEEKKENKNRKERKYEPKPLTEEEKLNKPKDAISLEDYLKSKEKPKEEEEKKEVKRIQDGKPLVKTEEKPEEILGTSGAGRKKGKKKKQKEINKEELDLNAQIGANLEISGANDRGRRQWKKEKKEKKEGKFVYNEKDFPEL